MSPHKRTSVNNNIKNLQPLVSVDLEVLLHYIDENAAEDLLRAQPA